MRPGRFQEFVISLAQDHPTATRAQADDGASSAPCGIAITTAAGPSRWGVVGQLPDGAKHDDFTDEPVHGDPPAPGDGPRADDAPEAWLAALLVSSASPEIMDVARWSVREEARPDHCGVTVRFHNTAKVFVRLL